jgi:hypothetical protein
MICGVPVAAIAEPHSGGRASGCVRCWWIPWRSLQQAPSSYLPIDDWLPTEFGFVGPVAVPPEPADWLVSVFEVPNTTLGFAGELGFVGTGGLSPEPADWRVPKFEVPITELGFVGEFGFVGTGGLFPEPAD